MTEKVDPRPLSILLVEDSEPDVVLMCEAFQDARILVDIVVAKNGRIALDMLEAAAAGDGAMPDLVLLDLNLPKVDGLDVLKIVKTSPALQVLPVVVVTSSKSPTDLRLAYERHANSVITKPLDPEEFLRIVRGIGDYWLTIVRLPSDN